MAHAKVTEFGRFAERFWAKINRDGTAPAHCPELGPCWVWTAAVTKFGYGKFSVTGRAGGYIKSAETIIKMLDQPRHLDAACPA